MADRDQRVDALMRHRGMAAVAAHGDLEGAGAGHHRSGHHGHFTDRNPRPVVQAEYRIHRKLLEQSILDHHRRAAFRLLGRLENEIDGTVKINAFQMFSHITCGTEQDGAVAVMAAGVHLPRLPRAMWKFVFFMQRQGVHVGTQADGACAAALAQNADNTGSGQPAMNFNPVSDQLPSHDVGGSRFLEGQLGVGVDIVTDGNEIGKEGNIKKFHGIDSATEILILRKPGLPV